MVWFAWSQKLASYQQSMEIKINILAEVFIENFLFGMLSAWLLVPVDPHELPGHISPRLSGAA